VADDALFLGPRVALGRAAVGIEWAPRLAEGGPLLTWTPDRAVASGTGDLVLTGGAWRWLEPGETDPARAAAGRYFTVWRRAPDGLLRAVLDGDDRPPPPIPDRVARRLLRSVASADGALVAEAGLLLDGEAEVGWYAVVSRGLGPDAEVLVDAARYAPAR
jgi:ketosteroid isomerase-like protein